MLEDAATCNACLESPYGAILGTVELVDCVEESDDHTFAGPYGWVFARPRPLRKPIPARGTLRLWTNRLAITASARARFATGRTRDGARCRLVTYEDVRPWARSIRNRVVAREMPPWHIDRNIGIQEFKDDPSLNDAEIALVAQWVDNGAPRGDPADMPPPRVFPDTAAWQIGEPDLIVRYPTLPVPAEGPDVFGSTYSPLEIEQDRYIKAIQHRPVGEGSQRVVHHALSFVVDLDEQTQMPSASGHFLVEYASGKGAEVYPEDIGVLLQAGKKLKLDYHLHPVGEQIDAVVELGIVLFPEGEQPQHIRWSKQLGRHSADLDIPAGELVRQDGYTMFQKAAKILAFQPHMHTLGKYQCLELIYPTSGNQMRTEVVNCARFNYNWHLVYQYTEEAAPLVPAGTGTILHVISWHDLTQEEYEQAIEARKVQRGRPPPRDNSRCRRCVPSGGGGFSQSRSDCWWRVRQAPAHRSRSSPISRGSSATTRGRTCSRSFTAGPGTRTAATPCTTGT